MALIKSDFRILVFFVIFLYFSYFFLEKLCGSVLSHLLPRWRLCPGRGPQGALERALYFSAASLQLFRHIKNQQTKTGRELTNNCAWETGHMRFLFKN